MTLIEDSDEKGIISIPMIRLLREHGHSVEVYRTDNLLTTMNEVIRYSSSDFVMRVDDDIYLPRDLMEIMVHSLKELPDNWGAIHGCVFTAGSDPYAFFNPDGQRVLRTLPTVGSIMNRFDVKKTTPDQPYEFRNVEFSSESMDRSTLVFPSERILLDATLLNRRNFQSCDGFDPQLIRPLMFDDLDISLALRAVKCSLWFLPCVRVWHLYAEDRERVFNPEQVRKRYEYIREKWNGKLDE